MKILAPVTVVLLAVITPAFAAAQSGDCVDADASSVLAGITGDFELSMDPQDVAQHVIFTSNVTGSSDAMQNVVIAQLDGMTGLVVPDTLTIVADNFRGNSSQNGPSWMYTPTGQLGIIYKAADGVHGVFRSTPPMAWNDFSYNYDGSPTSGSPVVLPNTSRGAYPGNSPDAPVEQATYAQYLGHCSSLCYAAYNTGLATDVEAALSPMGYKSFTSTQATKDASLYISACNAANSCGLFQAKIDDEGGFDSYHQIVSTGSNAPTHLAAAQHPVTGTAVIFTNSNTNAIRVWQQSIAGGPLSSVGSVSAPSGADHFRALSSSTQVVLNFLVRSGKDKGSYTIAVNASGTTLTAGPSNQVSTAASGTEMQWYPSAGLWAIFYQKEQVGSGGAGKLPHQQYIRCWVTP